MRGCNSDTARTRTHIEHTLNFAATGPGLETGFDQFGNVISRDADGLHARVVQHECDHLDGILYPMRIEDFTQFGYVDILFPEMDPNEDD